MHMKLQGIRIPCSFEDAPVAACIPICSITQANRNLAVSHRCKGNTQQQIMKITLKKMPAVASKGQNRGFYTDFQVEAGKDDLGKDYNRLKAIVTLEAKDPEGKAYQVEKTYNLLGRGVRDFQADFLSWSGRLLTDEELAAFDAETAMKGKPVIVELSHRREGKLIVADIDKFLPVPAAV
jgi:hypothetical protein